MAEIGTLPCIVGGVGEASGERAAELFAPLGAPIVQTTPVQAELAKIWTNILRYATFALPNLLMMDCERYDANVFEVIDLINRDYPRGGIGQPGLTAGTCLRKDFTFSEEKSNAPGMLLAVSRVHESVPLFLVDGVKRRLGGGLRERKVAVLGLAFKADTDDERDSLSHKLIRLLERELADVAVARPDRRHADGVLRGGDRRRRRGRRGHQPQRVLPPGGAAARSPSARARDCLVVDPWNALGTGQVFAYVERSRRAARMNRVLVTGGAGTIGAAVVRRLLRDPDFEVRVSDQRDAPPWMREGCEVHRGDLRVLAEARKAMTRLHARHPPGGDRRRDRELPQAPAHAHRGQQRPLQRGLPRRAGLRRRALRLRSSSSMVFERAEQYPTREDYIDDCPVPLSAYGFSKLTGEVYCRAAHDEHGLPYTICRPFNAYGPGEMPDDEPGIAHAVPDLIRKSLAQHAAAADLRLRRADAHAHARRPTSPTASSTAMAHPAGLNEDFNISADRELTVAEIARICWEACGNDPDELELEHLPSFKVDVVRRWPSVEKAERLLGWRARIGVEEGVAATAEWLRALELPAAS